MLLVKVIVLLVVHFANTFVISAATGGDRLVVDTGYAKYLGNLSYPDTVAHLGIPYAEPPLGDRRFRAPVPLDTGRIMTEARGQVINATFYPEFCIQGTTGLGDAGGAGSEDCLKVNIYSPTSGSNLPVLVYIHGGGYIYGNPANWPFDHWVHQSPNVVIVSIYYRLDSFGFLAHPDFASSSEYGDLNAGFLDQIQALRWVKQHISAFGGDPTRVTINGQSAGGSSVELHLVAHEGEQLFSGAIAQSVYRAALPSPEQQSPLFDFYAEKAGCDSGDLASQMDCLRNASIGDLARAQDASFSGPYYSFHPVIDGKVLTEHPTTAMLSGRFARVPLIVGSTSNETSYTSLDIGQTLKTFYPGLNDTDVDEYLAVYPSSDFDSELQRLSVLGGETVFICARPILATASSIAGLTAWAYRYNQPNPTSSDPTIVAHAAENWMMFLGTNTGFNGTTTFSPMTAEETAFAEELIAYWVSFVRAKNPNTFKLTRSPIWSGFAPDSKDQIVLQQNTTTTSGSFVEVEPQEDGDRCRFVASKAEKEQN
ncbi:alpha/beta-hydrolase [Guyanagaster necrorhizus]|uniref:Carboxylic ester hydrolase n=1 Tax=Guyanagaster necrorhizus TaxID=856835 RepID=A0A9P7VQU2_9AGAR|nr:alpha/beta-hydrolase [Guyanagaster necrorhizus MCA 3950]KAG7444765.1 alpha/beta-hydrolase [Guyanagaster necrorhizus MCA 3950]